MVVGTWRTAKYGGRRPARRARGGRSIVKRTPVWIRSNFTQAVTPVAVHYADLVPATDLDPGARVGSTAIRIRGSATIHLGAPAVTAAAMVVGVAVMDFELGAAIKPFENRNDVDWMYWRMMDLSSVDLGKFYTPINAPTAASLTHEYDVKSSRRMWQPGMTAFCFLQNVSIQNTVGYSFNVSTLLHLG